MNKMANYKLTALQFMQQQQQQRGEVVGGEGKSTLTMAAAKCKDNLFN